jgi:hypothetical protein
MSEYDTYVSGSSFPSLTSSCAPRIHEDTKESAFLLHSFIPELMVLVLVACPSLWMEGEGGSARALRSVLPSTV